MFLPLDAALLAASLVLVADRVPTFNVEPYCRKIAARAAPVGDADVCLRKEREARDELVKQWAQFPPADKAFCQELHTIGGESTYTELLTCLELQRDARMLREREKETTGRGGGTGERSVRCPCCMQGCIAIRERLVCRANRG